MGSDFIKSEVLKEACIRFGGNPASVEFLGGATLSAYQIHIKQEQKVMKVLSHSMTSIKQCEAELKWMSYLREEGINVCSAIKSVNGKLIEEILDDQDLYYVIVYQFAKGHLIQKDEWTPSLYEKWGIVLGKIHRVSKKHYSSQQEFKQWDKDLKELTDKVNEPDVMMKLDHLLKEMKNFPQGLDSYGLIHHDLHQHNFHVNQGELILFDLGDCVYHYFIYDLVISIYHALQMVEVSNKKSFYQTFVYHLIMGYQKENELDDYWIKQIPMLLKYRRIYSYLYFRAHFHEEELDDKVKQALYNMRVAVLQDQPFVEV